MSVRDGALSSLRDTFAGEIVLPGDADYDSARVVWNGMIDRRPGDRRPADRRRRRRRRVRFAREQDLVIAVRSGGHSISGLSTCDDGIVIDLSRMRGVQVDPERRTARAHGGALLDELDHAGAGVRARLPGRCHLAYGRRGTDARGRHGPASEEVRPDDRQPAVGGLVTAEGRLVRASEEENAELFWGLRGAGANFGIATSFEFRLHPLDPVITFGSLIHPVDRRRDLASIVREAVEAGPDELWLGFGIGIAGPETPARGRRRPVARVSALHCGPVEQAERDLARLRAFGTPVIDSIEDEAVPRGPQRNDEAMAWGHRFYMKSGVPSRADRRGHRPRVEHMARVPDGDRWRRLGLGVGACDRGGAGGGTAFTGRDAAFWIAAEILWEDPDAGRAMPRVDACLMADMAAVHVGGSLRQRCLRGGEDLELPSTGPPKYERLVALKRAWDPENVFRLNHNVRP